MLKFVLCTEKRVLVLRMAEKEGWLKADGGKKPKIHSWWCGLLLHLLLLLLQPCWAVMPCYWKLQQVSRSRAVGCKQPPRVHSRSKASQNLMHSVP